MYALNSSHRDLDLKSHRDGSFRGVSPFKGPAGRALFGGEGLLHLTEAFHRLVDVVAGACDVLFMAEATAPLIWVCEHA